MARRGLTLRAPWRQLVTIVVISLSAVAIVLLVKPGDLTHLDPPGTEEWLSEDGRPAPRGAPAADVAAFFAGLDPRGAEELAEEFPYVVSGLDGAPFDVRLAASQEVIGADDDRFTQYIGMPMLSYDSRGPGHGALIYGDLATADRIAVIVTGDNTQLEHPEDSLKKMAWGENLNEATGPGTAVIFWAGYTSPIGLSIESMRTRAADLGSTRLASFLAGLDVQSEARLFLVCHSYGTPVCARSFAEPAQPPVVSLTMLGSPGVGQDTAAGIGFDGPIYVATADSDWIRNIPHVTFAGMGHGADPTSPEFGATLLDSTGVDGHDGYLLPDTVTLECVAQIVTTESAQGCGA